MQVFQLSEPWCHHMEDVESVASLQLIPTATEAPTPESILGLIVVAVVGHLCRTIIKVWRKICLNVLVDKRIDNQQMAP